MDKVHTALPSFAGRGAPALLGERGVALAAAHDPLNAPASRGAGDLARTKLQG